MIPKYICGTIGFKFVSLMVHLSLFFLVTSQLGCKKYVKVDAPVTFTNGLTVYKDDATAIAVLTGIYAKISSSGLSSGGLLSTSLFASLSADDLSLYPGAVGTDYVGYYRNSLTNSNTGLADFWTKLYPIIFVTNSAIEGINHSENLTSEVKKRLLGEAKFIRAFCYLYLVNFYGDVALVLSTDYIQNSTLSRIDNNQVYQQIIADLKDAQALLSESYLKADLITSSNERVRPNKWAATALLARVYLYIRDWSNAETEATKIIDRKAIYDTVPLNNVFLKNSKESIWQLQPVNTGWNTEDARMFVLTATGPNSISRPVYLNNNLVSSFEIGDKRKSSWVNSVSVNGVAYYYPYKYKVATLNAPVSEYSTVLRISEQYLIRAEARTQQDNINGAQSDINIIRTRAQLANIATSDKASLLMIILHERQVEFFTEWAHRWFDLKRTGNIDAVMSAITTLKSNGTVNWQSYQQFYPIPLIELQRTPNLVQNTGY